MAHNPGNAWIAWEQIQMHARLSIDFTRQEGSLLQPHWSIIKGMLT
jgi:hypothetical protein